MCHFVADVSTTAAPSLVGTRRQPHIIVLVAPGAAAARCERKMKICVYGGLTLLHCDEIWSPANFLSMLAICHYTSLTVCYLFSAAVAQFFVVMPITRYEKFKRHDTC